MRPSCAIVAVPFCVDTMMSFYEFSMLLQSWLTILAVLGHSLHILYRWYRPLPPTAAATPSTTGGSNDAAALAPIVAIPTDMAAAASATTDGPSDDAPARRPDDAPTRPTTTMAAAASATTDRPSDDAPARRLDDTHSTLLAILSTLRSMEKTQKELREGQRLILLTTKVTADALVSRLRILGLYAWSERQSDPGGAPDDGAGGPVNPAPPGTEDAT